MVGKGHHHTSLHTPLAVAQAQSLEPFLFPSLPGRVVCEMPSAARCAAVGVGGRPLHHVVRDVLCEGDEGFAVVREQHRYPPSASAVRECGGNCRGRSSSLSENMQIVTLAVRAIYLPCVRCRGTLHGRVLHPGVLAMWQTHFRDLSPTAESCKVAAFPR